MKLTGFDYDVITLVTMSGHEVIRLMGLADGHYDRKCKAAGEQGGFLYGFMNNWSLGDQMSLDDEIELSITGHELGTLGKISEQESPSETFNTQFLAFLNSRVIEYNEITQERGEGMSLPEFVTEIEDLVSDSDVDVVFDNFVLQISKEDLFLGTEWYMRERMLNSSVYSLRELPGGLMMHVIGMTVRKELESQHGGRSLELSVRLMEYYGFNSKTMPPRMLAREVIALMVQLRTVQKDLREYCETDYSPGVVQRAALRLSTPTDAYKLSDEEVDKILEKHP